MKYSVIIPAYQCADTIESTVNSILNSGLSDFEIVIVNDGSPDSTPEICEVLSQKHSQVIYINKENGGVSSARNKGIDVARGEYILFMDSDDGYDENSLCSVAKILDTHNPDLLIFGLSFDYYKNKSIYRSDKLIYKGEGIITPPDWSQNFLQMFRDNALSSACTKIFKSDVIKKNNLKFNENVFIMEDFLFVLDYLKYTDRIYLLPQAIYRYRQPDDEIRVYTRMEKVDNLNTYLNPFYTSVESIASYLKENYNIDFPQGEEVLFSLFSMLMSQKAFYADINTLKNLSEILKNSPWASYKTDDVLISDLKNENFKTIIKRHKKIQLRHKIAVTIKKNTIYQKLKGN